MIKTVFASLVVFFAWQPIGVARDIYYGSQKESVTVTYGGATIFRFNEPVKTISKASRFIIKPADEANPDYSVLSVTPRFMRGVDQITFILANGSVINTKVATVSNTVPEKLDSFYDFKPKEDLIKSAEDQLKNGVLSEIDLMKAMIRGDKVNGFKVRPTKMGVRTGIPNISAELVSVYVGAELNGYVFKITNHSKTKSYAVDLEQLSLGTPNTALLSQVDLNKIEPIGKGKNTTYLRIVAKPSSVYYNVNLPVAVIKEEK